ncbi:helix-turn-helix domain-containing protein [Streptomyces sp. NPDC091209]|uniref:transcriptional regulator n=1 Tax=Streptomyces sp. NPDC091209 TaxID=3365974 RepID=UPI00382EE98D
MSSQDDVEEFAALLRRLKARTDRSYAALARRLNMNASTLHRYCAGEAVPLGFAPVERFAALCEAGPAERIELHRRWILAVAARQRSRTATGAESVAGAAEAVPAGASPTTDGAAEPVTVPTARPVPAPADGAGPAPAAARDSNSPSASDSGSGSGSGSATADDSVPETVTGSASATAAGSRSATAAGSVPKPAAGSVHAAVPAASPRPRTVPAGGLPGSPSEQDAPSRPTPRKPWYRRRVAIAAAVVTALLATLGGLSALPRGHSSATADDQASGTNTARAAGARNDSATPSALPSSTRGRPSGTPSPKASGKQDASPGPSASPSPTAGSAVALLTWTANSHRWATGCEHDYVIDKAPQQVPPPPAPQDASPWARTQNAVHGGQTLVDISVQGRTDAAVVLEALRVRVVGRDAPVKGNVYSTGQGCGGGMAPRSFIVDLDKGRPIARSVPGSEGATSTPAMRMPYRVSATDPEVLMVDARTVGCDCRWYLELEWSSQGRTGTERIDDHGVPFRTSGTKGLPHYWYASGGWTLTD